MKKALVMSSLMVAIAAAGLNAQETDGMEGQDDPMMDEPQTEDPMSEDPMSEDPMMEEGGEEDHAQVFMEIDADGDGVITQEEADQATDYPELSEQFSELDTDGDGVLTLMEFEEFDLGGGSDW